MTIGFAPTTAGNYGGTITVNADQTSGTNTISVSGTASPNMVGVWSGTLTISLPGLSNVCTESWVISGETPAGLFTGTWQSSGGTTVVCGQAGTLQGQAASTSAISGLTFNAVVSLTGCTLVGGSDVMAGTLTGGNALTAQAFDVARCPGLADISRSLTLSMHKQ